MKKIQVELSLNLMAKFLFVLVVCFILNIIILNKTNSQIQTLKLNTTDLGYFNYEKHISRIKSWE